MGVQKVVMLAAAIVAMNWSIGIEFAKVPLIEQKPLETAKIQLEKAKTSTLNTLSLVSSYVVSRKPLQGLLICLDPGHGGQSKWNNILYTGGTTGVITGQTESDVNLRVALVLREYLLESGANVVMTRIDDNRVSGCGTKGDELGYRVNTANDKNADLFVSIHHNEGKDHNANYGVVFYRPSDAGSISLATHVASSCSTSTRVQSIGARIGNYRVLRGIKMPGVLVEASFMSCPEEDQRLMSLDYNKLEAKGIAIGIFNYFHQRKEHQIDFSDIFSLVDKTTSTGRRIVERRSLFGVRYEEITYDPMGNIINVRPVGCDKPIRKSVVKQIKESAKKSYDKITKSKISRPHKKPKSVNRSKRHR